MVKMLLVDDRRDIVESIAKLGIWDRIGVEVIGCAYDGGQAYQMIQECMPDILLTDIKMPVMDGLELTRLTKELSKDCVVILLSSYDDFGYAQKALSLGAAEYILKPATVEKIEAIIEKHCRIIRESRMRFMENKAAARKLKESMPLLKSEFLRKLCGGLPDLESEEDGEILSFEKRMTYFSIALSAADFMVLVFTRDERDEQTVVSGDLLIFSMLNIIEESVREYAKSEVFTDSKGDIVCIMNVDADMDEECVSEWVYEFSQLCQERLWRFLNASVSVGIGRVYESFKDIGKSYAEAEIALAERFVHGKKSILNIKGIQKNQDGGFVFPYEKERSFLEYLSIGLMERAVQEYEEIVRLIQRNNRGKSGDVRKYLVNLVPMISRHLQEKGVTFFEAEEHESVYMERLESVSSIQELSEQMHQMIAKICGYIAKSREKDREKTLHEIVSYINKHYTDSEISLGQFSKKYYISVSNLSIMLKQALGMTFMEYITKLRMERAKLLLLADNVKVYDVAEQLGYADRRYFSEIFKKYTGLKPSEYMESVKKSSKEGKNLEDETWVK